MSYLSVPDTGPTMYSRVDSTPDHSGRSTASGVSARMTRWLPGVAAKSAAKPRRTTAVQPNNRELQLGNDEFIVSKSDLTGVVTYTNRVFMQLAGYAEEELLGMQHSLIRHPDMPRGVFRLMWRTLAQDNEFFGYVKNLCKDGSFYWVFANITPDFDAKGQKCGYYSVRRKPGRSAIATMSDIYTEMLAVEQQAGRKAAPDASLSFLNEKLDALGVSYIEFVTSLRQEGMA